MRRRLWNSFCEQSNEPLFAFPRVDIGQHEEQKSADARGKDDRNDDCGHKMPVSSGVRLITLQIICHVPSNMGMVTRAAGHPAATMPGVTAFLAGASWKTMLSGHAERAACQISVCRYFMELARLFAVEACSATWSATWQFLASSIHT